MNEYNSFKELVIKYKLVTPIWKYVIELIENELDYKEEDTKTKYILILFIIYFSLIDDGNICMSLNKEILEKKWNKKFESNKIMLKNKMSINDNELNDIERLTSNAINNYLDCINIDNLSKILGKNKIFDIEDEWLYLREYNVARVGIIDSIKRIFNNNFNVKSKFNYKDYCKDDLILTKGQEKAVIEGINKNLIITGGPGTGKTTSILFLLINILAISKDDTNVYLIAPSGKAASRMKESIEKGLPFIKDEFQKEHFDLIEKIKNLNESTIHRLLSFDNDTNSFSYNSDHKFNDNSIFVIDEASMIDICLFNSLLNAIPNNARVFIMGDKNQLPSVECGAVFGEFLKMDELKDNIIELDESRRFGNDTKIYELAQIINNGDDLNKLNINFKELNEFKIEEDNKAKPIFYYNYSNDYHYFEKVLINWGKKYYEDLKKRCENLDYNDSKSLDELFNLTEQSKILCAENEGKYGVNQINNIIKKNFISKDLLEHYPGEIMMIRRNNKLLDLYNGDSGILVTFKDDNNIYFMVKKASILVNKDEKLVNKIFKKDSYVFYPLRLISEKEIDLAYAITIHKSQGSDYQNILVILPKEKGHPLLNRQIVYTAITRTKGNTYIISSLERLDEAKDNIIVRDTNIAKK